jgi:hypothetical protein
MSTMEKTERETLHIVQVHDPNRQRSVLLEGVKASDTFKDIRARAVSELRLTAEVEWNVRDDSSGRLLHEDQRFGELLGRADSQQVALTMQPDAGLG